MNSTDPAVVDAWLAYYRVEPFGTSWNQSATIAAEVCRLGDLYISSKGGKTPPVKLRDFLPADSLVSAKANKPKQQTPQQMYRILRAR